MLTITKPANNRIDIEFDGKLDADGMRAGLDELIDKSDGIIHGQMLYRISEFNLPTIGAIGVELTRLPKLFSLLSKFDRCAVLSDAKWIRNAAEIEGAMFPGIQIKGFEPDQEEAAELWLQS